MEMQEGCGGEFWGSWWFWLTRHWSGDSKNREEGRNPHQSAFSALETDNALPPCQNHFLAFTFCKFIEGDIQLVLLFCLSHISLDFLAFPTGASFSSCHVRVQGCGHLW